MSQGGAYGLPENAYNAETGSVYTPRNVSLPEGFTMPHITVPEFAPDINLPPDYAPVRKAIMADPELRLDFHWNQAKAELDAKQIDTRRYTDSAVIPLIQADMKRNQEHINAIHASMDQFMQTLAHPYPIHKMASLDTVDALGALAGGLLGGGSIGAAVGATQQHNQAVEDNAYQNEVNQFGLEQHRAEQIVAAAHAELARAEGYQQQLQGEEISQTGHEADMAHGDIEKAKQRFQTATNAGEVQAAADELAGYGQPVSSEAIAEAKKAANIRFDHENRMAAAQEYGAIERQTALYGGYPDEASADAAQTQVDGINAKYGTAYPPVRGGLTWRAQQDQKANKYRADHLEAEKKKWETDAGIKDKQVAGELANWSSLRAYRLQEIGVQRDRIAVEALKKTDHDGIASMTRQRDIAEGELEAINQQLQAVVDDKTILPSEKRKRSGPLYAKQAALKARIHGYENAIGKVQAASSQVDGGAAAGSVGDADTEFKMASDALARHPEAADKIKAGYKTRTGKDWPGG